MLDFPNSPSLDQIFTAGESAWRYDGSKWQVAPTPEDPRLDALIAAPAERPGDAPELFGLAKSGMAEDIVPVDPSWVAISGAGSVLRVVADPAHDPRVVAPLTATALEPGFLYEVRFKVQRQTSPQDPLNDSVSCGVRWLLNTQAGNGSLQAIVENIPLTTAMGVTQRVATISTGTIPAADFTPPAGTVYFRPFVEMYGGDHVTDIIAIEVVRFDIRPGPFYLPKLAANPATGPGLGLAALYVVAGSVPGTASLRMQAGTSATAWDIAVNVGGGF